MEVPVTSKIDSRNKLRLNKDMVFFLGSICTILTIDTQAISGYEFQFLLPLFFTVFYKLLAPSMKDYGMGYLLLNIIWFFRYYITPLLIKGSNYDLIKRVEVSEEHLNSALFLMIVEMTIMLTFCFFCDTKLKKNKHAFLVNNNPANKTKVGNFLIAFLLILATFVFLFDSNAFNSFNFFFNTELTGTSNVKYDISVSFLSWTKLVFTIFLLNIVEKKSKKNRKIWVILAVVIVMLSISIVSGVNRASIVLHGLSFIFLLTELFSEHKKKIVYLLGGLLLFAFLLVTFIRFNNTSNLAAGLNEYNIENTSNLFNNYFGGQQNVAVGVKTLETFYDEYSIQTLIKDLFQNTIIINNVIPNVYGTVDYFNFIFYNHSMWADQISPLITQSLAHFNVLGFVIPGLLAICILKLDTLSKKMYKGNFFVFLTTLLSVHLAFYSPGNMVIISNTFTNMIVPLFFLLNISKFKLIIK